MLSSDSSTALPLPAPAATLPLPGLLRLQCRCGQELAHFLPHEIYLGSCVVRSVVHLYCSRCGRKRRWAPQIQHQAS